MKKSVTDSVKYIQDNLPVLIRGAFGIFNELLPEMKKGVMECSTTSFEMREYLERVYNKECGVKPEDAIYKDLPFSCMLIGVNKEKIAKAIRSLNKLSCSIETKASDSGEILTPIYAIRLSFLTNSEIFRSNVYVPEIHVSPRVQFAINTKGQNSGRLSGSGYDNWLPASQVRISPTGGFSSVNLIDYLMMIDIDSLYKSYVTKGEDVSEELLIERIVGSACITYLAAVSNSVSLYDTALGELINPIGGVLDEAFLEYNDLDAPVYNYQDRKTTEPHWIRLTVSKVSSLIDAVIRYDSRPYSGNNNVVGWAMFNLIQAYFAKKYAVSNTVYTHIGEQQILTSRLAERSMEQIQDPVVREILKESLESSRNGVYTILRDLEENTGYFVWRDKVVKMLQKTLILVAYSGVLINAVSGLDRKYDQFNNIFGRKGGYKGMVKKMVSVLWEHLDKLLDKAVDVNSDGDQKHYDRKLPINRWALLKTPNKNYVEYQDRVKDIWSLILRNCNGYNDFMQTFADEASLYNMVADDAFGLSTNTDWGTLQESLVRLHTHLKNIQVQTGEDPQYRKTEFVQLNEQAKSLWDENGKNIRTTSLEAFEAAIDEAEQEIGSENEFGSGMYSPVLATMNQHVHGANAFEDEAQDLMNTTITDRDPENIAEERMNYIKRLNVALERFDNLFYKLNIG